jgi:hypothetical protein
MLPGFKVTPVPVERALGQPEDRRGFVHRQAGEVAQEYDLGLEPVARFEFLQCLVDRQHIVRGGLEDGARLVKLPAPLAAAPFRTGLAARLFDQDIAHGARRRRSAAGLPTSRYGRRRPAGRPR